MCFCMKCGGRTSVLHLFPFSWKNVPTLSLLSSLILWKLPRGLLSHTFCAYCGWTSPNCDDTVLWANVFFIVDMKIPFWGLPKHPLLWTPFVTWHTCFCSVRRRFKLNYLFQHENLSVTSVLLSLGSSLTLCILVPRRQIPVWFLELIISLFSLVLFSKDF